MATGGPSPNKRGGGNSHRTACDLTERAGGSFGKTSVLLDYMTKTCQPPHGAKATRTDAHVIMTRWWVPTFPASTNKLARVPWF